MLKKAKEFNDNFWCWDSSGYAVDFESISDCDYIFYDVVNYPTKIIRKAPNTRPLGRMLHAL